MGRVGQAPIRTGWRHDLVDTGRQAGVDRGRGGALSARCDAGAEGLEEVTTLEDSHGKV